jgi:hypothetical protein
MNPLINRLRQRLQAFNDYQVKALAKVRDHKKRKNNALFARIGIKPITGSGPTNKKRIILHSIVSFALFAAISYWLVVMCFEDGTKPFFDAAFLPFLAPIIYLVTVHFLSKKK